MDKLVNEVKYDDKKRYEAPICFDIQSITANHKKNAFTVVWADGSHTIIHLQPGDVWDDEKALAMCFVKHMMGDTGSFNDIFTEDMPAKIKYIGKVEPVEDKHECKCNPPCEECKCKEESEVDKALAKEFVKKSIEKANNAFGFNKQTADELAKAAAKASNSMKEMIDALTGETETKCDGHYKVYLKIGGESLFDSEFTSIRAMKKRVCEIAKEHYGRKPYYYRTWMNNGRMMIDFGHHTQFIEVEGITPDEYVKH